MSELDNISSIIFSKKIGIEACKTGKEVEEFSQDFVKFLNSGFENEAVDYVIPERFYMDSVLWLKKFHTVHDQYNVGTLADFIAGFEGINLFN